MGKNNSDDDEQLLNMDLADLLEIEDSSLGNMEFERYTKPLMAGGYSYSDARDIVYAPVMKMLIQASHDIPKSFGTKAGGGGGLPADAEIGTMWYEGTTPVSEFGAKCKKEIDARLKSLTKIGLTPEDIRDFWDMAYFDRHAVHLSSLVKFKVAILEAERQLAEQGGNLKLLPKELAKGSVLTFSPVGSSVLLGPRDELPAEAVSKASKVVSDYIAKVDKAEFLETTLAMTMNGVARELLKA